MLAVSEGAGHDAPEAAACPRTRQLRGAKRQGGLDEHRCYVGSRIFEVIACCLKGRAHTHLTPSLVIRLRWREGWSGGAALIALVRFGKPATLPAVLREVRPVPLRPQLSLSLPFSA